MSASSTAAVAASAVVVSMAFVVRAIEFGRAQRTVRRHLSVDPRSLGARMPAPVPAAVIAIAGAAGIGLLPVAPAIAPIGAAAIVAVPVVLRRSRDRRAARAADAELPDVLEAVARALRAGASLPQAVAAVPAPRSKLLAAGWLRMASSVQVAGMANAARAWRSREGQSPATVLAASALCLASEVGGPQARAIDAAAVALRQRLALEGEIRSQAAQARASALVIGCAPVAFAVLAAATDPKFVPFLVRSPLGAALLYAGLTFDAAGLLWMERLVRTVSA
jgi:tight adherence protein B